MKALLFVLALCLVACTGNQKPNYYDLPAGIQQKELAEVSDIDHQKTLVGKDQCQTLVYTRAELRTGDKKVFHLDSFPVIFLDRRNGVTLQIGILKKPAKDAENIRRWELWLPGAGATSFDCIDKYNFPL